MPVLNAAGLHPVLVQTRGRNFLEYMHQLQAEGRENCYPVDTVLRTGEIQTDWIPCWGAFSLGSAADRQAFEAWFAQQDAQNLRVIGVGITEAG